MKVQQLNGDLFIPGDGFNGVFRIVENCAVESNPTKEGMTGARFMLRKRDGHYSPKLALDRNPWETKGNIVQGKKQNNEIFYYTDEGYVYRFDGITNRIVLSSPYVISSTSGGSAYTLGGARLIGQSFVPDSNGIISSVTVSVRKKGSPPVQGLISLKLSLTGSKDTAILISSDIFESSQISSSFSNISFNLFNYSFTSGVDYTFYLESSNVDETNCFEVQYGASSYAGGKVRIKNGTRSDDVSQDINFAISSTKPLFYDITRSPDMLNISYLGGGVFGSELTVASYDTPTRTITFTWAIGNPDTYVGKIAYISLGDGIRQRRYITKTTAADKLTIDSDFNVVPTAGSKVKFYNKLANQIWFNQLRKGTTTPDNDFLYSLDIELNNLFWYYPLARDIIVFDNRIIYSKKDGTGIIGTSNIDLEIPLTTTVVDYGNDQILRLFPYGGYIFVGFKNNIRLVKKKITNDATGAFIYKDQGLTDEGLYSRGSFLLKGGGLRIITGDVNAYDVDLSFVSLDEVIGDLKPFGLELINYFKNIEGGTIDMLYSNKEIMILHKIDGKATILKYNESYQGWIIDTYFAPNNFMNFIFSLNGEEYYPVGNSMKRKGGITDSGLSIAQRIVMDGPVDRFMNIVAVHCMKAFIGYDEYGIGGQIHIEGGGNTKIEKLYELNKLKVFQDINLTILPESGFGSDMFGAEQMGGKIEFGLKKAREGHPNYIHFSMNPGSQYDNYVITVSNSENRQMYFGGIWVVYEEDNAKTIKTNNVLNSSI